MYNRDDDVRRNIRSGVRVWNCFFTLIVCRKFQLDCVHQRRQRGCSVLRTQTLTSYRMHATTIDDSVLSCVLHAIKYFIIYFIPLIISICVTLKKCTHFHSLTESQRTNLTCRLIVEQCMYVRVRQRPTRDWNFSLADTVFYIELISPRISGACRAWDERI